ncbi:uncharacterized protein STEHIDRAFT_35074, partial [Stereum hirsutum FP-91666 SS1]|uniref:uncharacterized protein n=1 Tax=Stereum hirsutum (strain FP-91666) TaxID=721885 RepID=UPI000444A550
QCFEFEAAKGGIYYLEALTIVSALERACSLTPRPKRVIIFCDNSNSVDVFNSLSADAPYNDIL